MSFHSLSNELIIEIFHCLIRCEDLISVSLCCHRFKNLAEPVLYSTFDLVREHTAASGSSISLFLRQIRLRPDLAQHVKHFVGEASWGEADEFDLGGIPLILSGSCDYRYERHWVRQTLPNEIFGEAYCDRWYNSVFATDNWDAVVAFLIMLLPNLESISMKFRGNILWEAPGNPYIYELLSKMQAQEVVPEWRSTLPAPHQVNFESAVETMLSLSRERSSCTLESSWNPAEIFYVTSVTLNQSHMSPDTMRSFLKSFVSLKKFGFEESVVDNDGEFTPNSVRDGLQNSKDCLEELSLRITDDEWGWGDTSNHDPASYCQLGSLADYKMLRILTIDCRVLFGHSLFYICNGSAAILHHRYIKGIYQTQPEPEDAEEDSLMYFHRASLEDLDPRFYTKRPFAYGQELPPSLAHLSIHECTSPILGYMAELFLFNEEIPKSLKTVTLTFGMGSPVHSWHGRKWEDAALSRGILLKRKAFYDDRP